MSHHYTKSTEEATTFCNTCHRQTVHFVSDGRLGRCKEHGAEGYSKKQLKQREERKRREEQPDLFCK